MNNYAAYTGFEADGTGNFSYTGKPVADITAPTGSLVYPLGAGSITSPYINTSYAYILSLWSKGAAPSVAAGSTAFTGTLLQTNGSWNYYEYQVASGTGQVAISGSTAIDELRLYPAASQMTTYSYDPSGLRAIEDPKGTNSYL